MEEQTNRVLSKKSEKLIVLATKASVFVALILLIGFSNTLLAATNLDSPITLHKPSYAKLVKSRQETTKVNKSMSTKWEQITNGFREIQKTKGKYQTD